jgi:DNA-binding MarR family transcriptional regulator
MLGHAARMTTGRHAFAAAGSVDVAELASNLRLAVARLSRRIRQETAIAGDALTSSTQAALASIEGLGPITLGELATVEQVQPPTMSRIVARLEELGYVVRVVDPADRRVARSTITETGRDLLALGRTRKDAYFALRVATLTEDERSCLARALPLLERLHDDGC